jgi:phage terminase small subunit
MSEVVEQSSYTALNRDQRKFVDCYVDGAISGADAVIEAGFAHFEGFSEHDVAIRLLGSPKIQRAIAERVRVLHDQGVASDLWMMRKLIDSINTNISQIYDEDGEIIHPRKWSKALQRMVRKIRIDKNSGRVVEVALESHTKVLELFGRMDRVGAFAQENEGNETVVVVRDMTARNAEEPKPVDDIPMEEIA